MFLFIARHAWAGEHGDPRWPDDSLRELTPEGMARYTKVVKALADRGFNPGRIATSPYTRCRQTADIIAHYVASDPTIDELKALEPGSELEPLLEWSLGHAQNNESLCWVGHSPDVEWLTSALVGDGAARIRFAKGAIAAISLEGEIDSGAGELCWLATAKSLGF
jgi:phosphohistidine phosphatase SixA